MALERERRATLVVALAMALWISGAMRAEAQFKVGFYSQSCPRAEAIVKEEIEKALADDEGVGADLLRMHFHDYFGCDGSILLDSTNTAEKDAQINLTLEGFDIIDDVKEKLEAACKGVVSCADLLAFAARDAVAHYGGIHYEVPSGRRDGRISVASDTDILPSPDFKLSKLTDLFVSKGLSQSEMIVLSGAHTVGIAHCDAFSKRLDSADPRMDVKYAAALRKQCPPGSNNTVSMDPHSPHKFDNHYYRLVLDSRGLFTSDDTLLSAWSTAAQVKWLACDFKGFQREFEAAIVKMGAIGVLTGYGGEVRTNCRVVN
ncbi:peroxidase 5-like isoform X2 [Zingiber officinale]|uniref:peroxidase 5-like isoform X2 n=1 Tax=Zingiber officinale TaxID=94328 RepID=UPI001C4CAD78|nr:peroxidase 5-like isoform X2 [Zingiber officinale]